MNNGATLTLQAPELELTNQGLEGLRLPRSLASLGPGWHIPWNVQSRAGLNGEEVSSLSLELAISSQEEGCLPQRESSDVLETLLGISPV